MQFFAGTNADRFYRAARRQGRYQITETHAGDFRHEDFPSGHLLDGANYKAHSLVKGDPEPGHPRVGNRHPTVLALFLKNRNYAPSASHHISVAHAAKARRSRSAVGVRLDK